VSLRRRGLRRWRLGGTSARKFDVVCDPPARRGRKDRQIGAQGYRKLSAGGTAGGAAASCSRRRARTRRPAAVAEQVSAACTGAQRTGASSGARAALVIRCISLPETAYLKALTLQLD
jgi:hypothetical protein